MEKKFDIEDEWEMLLDDQLIKEAELLEKELFADDGFEDYQETQEECNTSYEKLVNRLKADGIYREETNENDEEKERDERKENKENLEKSSKETKIVELPVKLTTEPGENTAQKENKEGAQTEKTTQAEEITQAEKNAEIQETGSSQDSAPTQKTADATIQKKMQRRLSKVAVLLIVSSLGIFAAALTSEANRNYWLHNVRILTGRDTQTITYNDETNETANMDEKDAIAKIEQELHIEVPEFYYRPYSFVYSSYEVDVIAGIGRMEYIYNNNNIIDLYMEKNQSNSISDNSNVPGEEIEKIKNKYENIEVNIGEIVDEKDKLSSCYAKWEYNDAVYSMYGRMEFDEFQEMISKFAY